MKGAQDRMLYRLSLSLHIMVILSKQGQHICIVILLYTPEEAEGFLRLFFVFYSKCMHAILETSWFSARTDPALGRTPPLTPGPREETT